MSNPYIGEIKIFSGTFPPLDWAFCNGQLMPVPDYSELYAVIGTTYGGDGRTNFALPDFRRRIPVHRGEGPGLMRYSVGQSGGSESVQLTSEQMPAHRHQFMTAKDSPKAFVGPWGNYLSGNHSLSAVFPVGLPNPVAMSDKSVTSAGNNQSHYNLMPCLGVHFIIALKGTFPAPN